MTWIPGKVYVCRDPKYRARIYAVDGSENYPIHGAIFKDRHWIASFWNPHGSSFDHMDYNLTEIEWTEPVKKKRWLAYMERDPSKWAKNIVITKSEDVDPDFWCRTPWLDPDPSWSPETQPPEEK